MVPTGSRAFNVFNLDKYFRIYGAKNLIFDTFQVKLLAPETPTLFISGDEDTGKILCMAYSSKVYITDITLNKMPKTWNSVKTAYKAISDHNYFKTSLFSSFISDYKEKSKCKTGCYTCNHITQ